MHRGIGNYVRHLLDEFAKSAEDDSFVLYIDDETAISRIPTDARFEARLLSPKFYPAFEQIALPLRVRRDRLDLLHSPGNTAPVTMSLNVPIVLTLHDTIFFEPMAAPHRISLAQSSQHTYYRLIAPRSARVASEIITDSQFSKRDILKHLESLKTPVSVVHLGVGPSLAGGSVLKDDPAGQPAKKFVFALGARDPRKNTKLLLTAFAQFCREHQVDHELVVAGLEGATHRELALLARELQIADRTQFLGFVSDGELGKLYRSAQMFVFPSLYEGFGLPALEAMRYGTPVIASNRSAIPEIVGDAALLFDPTDSAALASHMTLLASDAGVRRKLSAGGLGRASEFSWKKTAMETRAVYRRALERERA